MSTETRHPHIEKPTEEQIVSLLQDKSDLVRDLFMETHRLILETLPDVTYSIDCKDGVIGYGARQYGYDGWGLASLAAHAKWVSLAFLRGTNLEDPEGLLEGTGKKMRHVKLRSREQFEQRRNAVRGLIESASVVNQM